MKRYILVIAAFIFLFYSCKNKTRQEEQAASSDTTKVSQPFIPSLPEGKDSSYITDTVDFGAPLKDKSNFNLQQILTKHLNAMGQARLKKIQTKIITGRTYAGGQIVTYKNIFKRPNKSYVEVDYGESKLYQGFDGEKAWRLYTLESDIPLYVYDDQLNSIKDQSEFDDILLTYKGKGLKLEPYGMAEVNGQKVYRIRLINEGMSETYFFIDATDYKLVKSLTRITYLNNESDYETIFKDYKKVDGIMVAFQVEEIVNNQSYSRILIDNIEFDRKVDDRIFIKPETAPEQ